ncbi:MAG: ecotin family protein [Thermodesulfobacteriota bacterium]|nr:ecotin family protein [Thermodesulfobacteriota bacterium]
MKNIFKQLLVVCLALFSAPAFAAEQSQLKAFPPAAEGMERTVIELPHKERGEEDNFKVELIPGKVMLTDGVNLTRIGLSIVPQPLKGWGYTYYEVTGSDAAISTLMAVPESKEKVSAFVPGSSLHIQYNSRLPIVIYASRGYEIRYRIWSAGTIQKTGNKSL